MLTVPRFQLFRLGSDPEFLFAKRADLDYVITPASTILGKDKAKTTHSFIGTDNRPVIAEIRPTPSRNLKRHMYDLAYAVDKAQSYVNEKHPGHVLLACPHYHNENLGGHIHVSGYLDDPTYLKLQQAGYTLNSNNAWKPIPGKTQSISNELQRELVDKLQSEEVLTPYEWAQVMNHILAPFEFWLMPWVQREKRSAHYGDPTNPDVVRTGMSTEPYPRERLAYVHWEYRLPSTWLHHPYLAMAYLSLVKLVMLNFRTVANAYVEAKPKSNRYSKKHAGEAGLLTAPHPGNSELYNFSPIREAENEKHFQLFQERLMELKNTRPIITPDISDVFRMIELCGEYREKWFSPTRPVMVEEWRRLL